MDTALVREAYIRFYKDLRRRGICDQPRCGMANRSGECIGPRHWGIKRLAGAKQNIRESSTKLWKGVDPCHDSFGASRLRPIIVAGAACRVALRRSSTPEADHGACSGQRRCAPAQRWLVRWRHAARGDRRAFSKRALPWATVRDLYLLCANGSLTVTASVGATNTRRSTR
jgi:hypothetical protein